MITKKRLGIIGGMGSHASACFFQKIINLTKVHQDQDYIDIILHNNSDIPDRTQAILYGGESPLEEFKRSLEIFNMSKVDVAVLACMTAHYYYNDIVKLFRGKVINVLDLLQQELMTNPDMQHKKRVGVIASTGFIKSKLLHSTLEPLGFEVIQLDDEDQDLFFMNPMYKEGGIKSGVIEAENKRLFLEQIPILKGKGAEIIIGACSEVPLLITSKPDIPFIDAFELLAAKTVDYCFLPQQVV